jgi:hypothetical protein
MHNWNAAEILCDVNRAAWAIRLTHGHPSAPTSRETLTRLPSSHATAETRDKLWRRFRIARDMIGGTSPQTMCINMAPGKCCCITFSAEMHK